MELIKSKPTQGERGQSPGEVVLRKRVEEPQYVVHWHNFEIGGYYEGHYCFTQEEAEEHFDSVFERFRNDSK